jgi:hypothetical protein
MVEIDAKLRDAMSTPRPLPGMPRCEASVCQVQQQVPQRLCGSHPGGASSPLADSHDPVHCP